MPTLHGQQIPDPTTTKSTALGGQCDDSSGEHILVGAASRDLALCRSVLTENSASSALGDIQHRGHMIDTGSVSRGA